MPNVFEKMLTRLPGIESFSTRYPLKLPLSDGIETVRVNFFGFCSVVSDEVKCR